MRASLGSSVDSGDVLGVIGDPFGDFETEVRAPARGMVIGRIHLPLVNEGDALFHVARLDRGEHEIAESMEAFHSDYILSDTELGEGE
jgi:hypothetical protein